MRHTILWTMLTFAVLCCGCRPNSGAAVGSGSTEQAIELPFEAPSIVDTITSDSPPPPVVPNQQLDPVATGLAQRPILAMAVRTVEFSPNGELLASGSGEGEIVIWKIGDTAAVEHRWTGHDHWIFDIAFNSAGNELWTASGDNKVKSWKVGTWDLLQTYEDHEDDVHGLALTKDGKHLVTGGDDGLVIVRNLETDEVRRLAGHDAQVTSVALVRNDSLIVSSSRDQTVRIWDLATGAEVAVLEGHQEDVLQVVPDEKGERLVSASYDGTTRIWSLADYSLLQEVEVSPAWVFTALPLTERNLVISGAGDQTVYAHTDSGLPQFKLEVGADVSDLKYSPDGDLLAVATSHGGIHLMHVERQKFSTKEILRMRQSPDEVRQQISLASYLEMHEALLTEVDSPQWSEKVGMLSLSGDQFTLHLIQKIGIDDLPAPKREMARRLEDKLNQLPAENLSIERLLVIWLEKLAMAELSEKTFAVELKSWMRESTAFLRTPQFVAEDTLESLSLSQENSNKKSSFSQTVEARISKYSPHLERGSPFEVAQVREKMRALYAELKQPNSADANAEDATQ
ncbi:MAG: WD40 repeat domain-containing protein [Planctomycetaceae bacterium]|nr:WD40 repeat domain-containing protein [Planctomycetaceae bacterium]MCA9043739.1 WD40 repeat domain-containing protein [Planctomycetaceae bacterium]